VFGSTSPKVTKGLKNSIDDLKTSRNYIICITDEDYPIAANITVCNIFSFVENHLQTL
jgi:hypothetical protein